MSVSTIWEEMETQTATIPSQEVLARRIFPRSDVNLFAAIRTGSNSRLLILKCQLPADHRPDDFPVSRGFTVRFVRFADDQPSFVSVELESAGPLFSEVFSVLVDDVATDLSTHGRKGMELAVLRVRLDRWQNFFEQHDPEGLGEEAQRGLFGELWCLRELLLPHISPLRTAVEGWTGPAAAAKDFELPGCAIEVKSSLSKQHHRILIANERQLDDAGFDNLFLLCLLMEKTVATGEALPDMVAATRTSLAGTQPALVAFNERLISAGYLDVHHQLYTKVKYSVRDHQFFRVRKGFPRIVSDDIQPGVGDVRYSIVLSSCAGFRIADDEIITVLTSPNNDP